MGKGTKKTNLYSKLISQITFFKKADVPPIYLVLPALLSIGAAFFEGVSIALLVPMVKGIIQMDFAFIREFIGIKNIIAAFPHLFTRPNSSVFILLLGIIFTASIIKNILLYLAFISVDYQVRNFTSRLRKLVVERYFSFGKLFFDKNSQGALHEKLLSFTYSAAFQLVDFHKILKWFFLFAIYLIIMVTIFWKLTVFILIIPP